MSEPEGVLLVDKPRGMTSHDVVDVVRKRLGTRKVGHAGTLDPMATGLLVLGVGRGTRLLRFLGALPKTYEGTARLGVETTTLDAEGEVTAERPVTATESDIRDAMSSLLGDSLQVPPAYSAVKVGGRKLYEAARRGEVLEASARPIRVDGFELTALHGPDVEFRVTCSGGTYVRVLLADVGAALGSGAHLTRLRRTAIGALQATEAVEPSLVGDADAVGAGGRAPPASGAELRGGGRGGSRPGPRAGRHPGAVRGLRARRGVDRRL